MHNGLYSAVWTPRARHISPPNHPKPLRHFLCSFSRPRIPVGHGNPSPMLVRHRAPQSPLFLQGIRNLLTVLARQSASSRPHSLHRRGKFFSMLVGHWPMWTCCFGCSFNLGVHVPCQAGMAQGTSFILVRLSLFRCFSPMACLRLLECRLHVSFCGHLPASPAESR